MTGKRDDKMDEYIKGPQDYVAILRRRRWHMLLPAAAVFGMAVLAAFVWPPTYRSSATVLIERPEVPPELVQSTVTSFADQRLQTINQRVMTTQNLIDIINEYNLYPDERKKEPITVVVEGFRENINFELVSADVVDPQSGRPMQATIAFMVSFDHTQPRRAQEIANELVSLYLAENLRQRQRTVAETASFLEQEVARLDRFLGEQETKLAKFKVRYAGRLPEQQEMTLRLVDRTERDLVEVEHRLRSSAERRIYLETELTQTNPYGTYTVGGQVILGPVDRLKALRTQFISLRGIYGARHPDVVRIHREIEALERETGISADTAGLERQLEHTAAELAVAKEKYGPAHPDVVKLGRQVASLKSAIAEPRQGNPETRPASPPDNPTYIRLQGQLQIVHSESRSLKNQKAALRENLAKYEKRLLETPNVEREYTLLQRDYDNARSRYQELKNKLLEARLSESLETEKKGERFTLLEPPLAPLEPIKPNRPAIVFLGFVFAIVSGVGMVALAESLDQAVYGDAQLAAVTGARPLAVVPYIETKKERRRARTIKALGVAGFMTAMIAGAAGVHFYIAPLDVFWFRMLRELDLWLDAWKGLAP